MSKIFTNVESCLGCNKCALYCPTQANQAKFENCKNKIYVNENRCIDCGECISICDHNSRDYEDDTERLFDDLESGIPISIVVAPAARTNFKSLDKLFGFFKNKGVNLIFDVSFGADICTWGYLKVIKQQKLKSLIAQPCPVVVEYIEYFKPSLIKYLSPIQSPALCTAIYLNKYLNNTDKIAFLSPCIAKVHEFKDPNSGGFIHYNVTYKKLIQYMEKHNIDWTKYSSIQFDNSDSNYGFAFSRPGGLKENVYFYVGEDAWVTQIEGTKEMVHYLNEYEKEVRQNKNLPLLVDILNCSHGCNLGTGTLKTVSRNTIDYITNNSKSKVDKEKAKELFLHFDKILNLNDFIRGYLDKSKEIIKNKEDKVEEVFIALGKDTLEKRNINCFCCGYGSCRQFAIAIANGHNHYDNCVHYLELSLAKNLTEFDKKFQVLSTELSSMNFELNNLNKISKTLQDISTKIKIISINASIESAHAGEAGKSFAVIAKEIKRLSDISANTINKNTSNTNKIINDLHTVNDSLESIQKELHQVLRVL